MDFVLQVSLLVVSVCLGFALLARRTIARSGCRIDVDPVSSTWLVEHRVRSRPE